MIELVCINLGFRDDVNFCRKNLFKFWKIFLVVFSFKLRWGVFLGDIDFL